MSESPLRRLAASRPVATPDVGSGEGVTYDAPAFLRANDDDLSALDIYIDGQTKDTSYGMVDALDGCPYSQDHTDGAFRVQFASGYVDVQCQHNRCKGKRLKDHPDLFPRSHEVKKQGEAKSWTTGELTAGGGTNGQHDSEPATFELIPPKQAVSDRKPVMHGAAYYGLAGDVVRAIAPTTEADPVALLITLLTMFGNACGRGPHVLVGDSRHGANVFTVLVGETSRARKGTSQDGPLRLMKTADAEWSGDRIQGGISSGEGIIWAVHDEVRKWDAKAEEWTVTEPGIPDKRLLCIEEEMSLFLKTAQRQGSTVTEIIRRAWDSRTTLQTMTKSTPAKATDAHISILAHITKMELARQITETDLANGLANRFAWFRVGRERLLPNPIALEASTSYDLSQRIAAALAFAREVGTVTRDADASDLWNAAYPVLEADRPGLAGAITARASPIAVRLSLIYALLDQSRVIRPDHLMAALAVWEYAAASVTSIFGDLTGDAVADRILTSLQTEGRMSKNDLYEAFGRNMSAARIGHALDMLHTSGRIQAWKAKPEGGKGRPATFYEIVTEAAA